MQRIHERIAVERSIRPHAGLKALPIGGDVRRHEWWIQEWMVSQACDIPLCCATAARQHVAEAVQLT